MRTIELGVTITDVAVDERVTTIFVRADQLECCHHPARLKA
jgi:hypothetical protein